MATRRQRRRRPDAELYFNGQAVGPDLLPSLHREGERQRWHTRYRREVARGIRLKTLTVNLAPTWVQRHPEAADWVVKVLPERRTLERDLIASVAAVEPTYSRAAIGKERDRDFDDAASCENYMEEWRRQYVDYESFAEKGSEDGDYAVLVVPTDVDREGWPDFYDYLSKADYDDLPEDDERRSS